MYDSNGKFIIEVLIVKFLNINIFINIQDLYEQHGHTVCICCLGQIIKHCMGLKCLVFCLSVCMYIS
jgi:hypothetical protein